MTLPDDEARKLAELVLDEYSSMHPEDAELIEEKKNLARKVKELLDRQRWIPVKERQRLVYNKQTKKIDIIRISDGLVSDSFDPPEYCHETP